MFDRMIILLSAIFMTALFFSIRLDGQMDRELADMYPVKAPAIVVAGK